MKTNDDTQIIHCRDCIYWQDRTFYDGIAGEMICRRHDTALAQLFNGGCFFPTEADDFCSLAKEKAND